MLLLLERDDPGKELDFEVEFQLSLTAAQRYKIMSKLVRQGIKLRRKHGYQATPTIVKRS